MEVPAVLAFFLLTPEPLRLTLGFSHLVELVALARHTGLVLLLALVPSPLGGSSGLSHAAFPVVLFGVSVVGLPLLA